MQYFGFPMSPQSPLFLGIPVQYIVMWGYQVLAYPTRPLSQNFLILVIQIKPS